MTEQEKLDYYTTYSRYYYRNGRRYRCYTGRYYNTYYRKCMWRPGYKHLEKDAVVADELDNRAPVEAIIQEPGTPTELDEASAYPEDQITMKERWGAGCRIGFGSFSCGGHLKDNLNPSTAIVNDSPNGLMPKTMP